MFGIGSPVYVTAKMQPRFQHSDLMELKVQDVEFLQAIKAKAIDRITISLAIDLLDDQIVTELGELINSNPGKTKVFFQLIDGTGKHHVLLRSTTKTVDVKSVLVNFIDHTPALDYKIN
jgi:DNA polymerase-3 subunit alpha